MMAISEHLRVAKFQPRGQAPDPERLFPHFPDTCLSGKSRSCRENPGVGKS